MFRSLPLSIAMSLIRGCADILAVCSGVVFSAQTAFAFSPPPPPPQCGITINGSTNVGSTFGVVGSIYVADGGSRGNATKATAEIDWGDGTASVPSVGQNPIKNCTMPPNQSCETVFQGGARHTYSAPMTGIHITVSGIVYFPASTSNFSCATPNFDVVEPPPPPPPPPGGDVLSNPRLVLRTARLGAPITGVIARFSDSNPSAVVSDFTALIDWGDGTQSQGVVAGSGGTLSISGDGHAYEQRGAFTVSVSLSAPGVASSTATGKVLVR